MITQKARYAFKALIVLAGESQDRLRTEAIAARGAIPRKFLERILLELKASGLIESRREGRSVIYSAQYDTMTALLEYLMQDCCGGSPEICASLADVVLRSQCLPSGNT